MLPIEKKSALTSAINFKRKHYNYALVVLTHSPTNPPAYYQKSGEKHLKL